MEIETSSSMLSGQDPRQAEARHAAHEKRVLAEVDRARQSAKQLEAGLAREQQHRNEEAAAQTLEAGRRVLPEAPQAAQAIERELRDRLADQASALPQAQAWVIVRSVRIYTLDAKEPLCINLKERTSCAKSLHGSC